MKIILSPSKTQNNDIRIESLNNPKYFKLTKMIIKELKSYSDDDISKIMKIKGKVLDETIELINNFKNKPNYLTPAILNYTGVVYESLNYEEYSELEREYLNNNLRIVSALYGVLRPMDGVQNYRLDFTMKLKNINLNHFWKEVILKEFKNESIILDCASQEFSQFLKPLKDKVHRVEFIDVVDGKEKIISYNAKKMRGLMAHYCIKHQIKKIEEIQLFDEDGYTFDILASNKQVSIFKRSSNH